MKRRIAVLLAAALSATALMMLAPASPVSADVCAGKGTATTPPLLYPLNPSVTPGGSSVVFPDSHVTGAWTFSTDTGACAPGLGVLTAGGTLQGYCGHSTGTGFDDAGHLLAWTSIGTFLFLTHEVTGVASALPDVVGGQSCATGATKFIVVGAVNRVNCIVEHLESGLTTVNGVEIVLTDLPGGTGTVHLRIPPLSVHRSVHACVGSPL